MDQKALLALLEERKFKELKEELGICTPLTSRNCWRR